MRARERSREQKKQAYLHCVRAYVSVCVCWSVVVVFSYLCCLLLSSDSERVDQCISPHPAFRARTGSALFPPAYRRHSLTRWLHIRNPPPELTLLNGDAFFTCKWSCGWITGWFYSVTSVMSTSPSNALQNPALSIFRKLCVSIPVFCLCL